MKCAMGAVTQVERATPEKPSTGNYQPVASGRTTELPRAAPRSADSRCEIESVTPFNRQDVAWPLIEAPKIHFGAFVEAERVEPTEVDP